MSLVEIYLLSRMVLFGQTFRGECKINIFLSDYYKVNHMPSHACSSHQLCHYLSTFSLGRFQTARFRDYIQSPLLNKYFPRYTLGAIVTAQKPQCVRTEISVNKNICSPSRSHICYSCRVAFHYRLCRIMEKIKGFIALEYMRPSSPSLLTA